MPYSAASAFDYMTPAQIADVQAGTTLVDVTAAVQAAVTANVRVVAPAGAYLTSSVVSIPAGHELVGEGESATVFARSGSDMSFFRMGTGAELHNVKFRRVGTTTATSGRLIDVQVSNVRLTDIRADHFWDGIYIKTVAGLSMERIYLDHFQNAGINCDGVTNDVFLQDFIITNIGSNLGTGIRLHNKVEAFSALNGDVIGGNYGMTTSASGAFDPNLRANPNFNKFTNVYFDSSISGVSLEKAAVLTFVSCWFATSTLSNGVTVGNCWNVAFIGCQFVNNGSSGAYLGNTGARGIQFSQCQFLNNNEQGNGSNGLSVAAGVSDWSVVDSVANNGLFTPSPGQGYGIFVAAGASDRYVIAHCNLGGNIVGAVSDAGTGTNKKISSNVSYSIPYKAPTLAGAWVNSGGLWEAAGYCKDANGLVRLRGMVTGGVSPGLIFSLPVGYRPAGDMRIATVANNAFAAIEVKANGDVNAVVGSATGLSLAGVAFQSV